MQFEIPTTGSPLFDLVIQTGINVLGAIVILIVGWFVAGWTMRFIRRLADRSERLDKTIIMVLARLARWAVLVFTVIAVLNRFGVQTASIVALLGAAGLAVGLSLQGTLANVASGVMILMLRPFKVGDAVDVGGSAGVVDDIGLFSTKMHTFDNIAMHVPNSRIWGSTIKNFSENDTRRVDMEFGIGYGDDIDQALRIIEETIAADERVLAEPEPLIALSSLGESSVNIMARPWTKRTDFFKVKIDVTKKIKERFDQEGITIPYPQRDVHLIPVDKAAAD
ncbi:MAG: mechanosensitive ion channel [Trueperaceae bacterium]|nr:MAG: mechanosensitive ion channel [Trueperaceae bacterium]